MDVIWLLLIIAALIVAAVIFYAFANGFSKRVSRTEVYVPPSERTVGGWRLSDSPATCAAYRFQSAYGNNSLYFPPLPSFNDKAISGATQIATPTCIPQDVIYAAKNTRTCTAVSGEQAINCISLDGSIVNIDAQEEVFTQCTDVPACQGTLSLISFGKPGSYCLRSDGTMAPCDPTKEEQLFLISNTGLYTSIQNYGTGQCLLPDTSTPPTIVAFGSTCSIDAVPLAWGDCSAANNQWLSIASISEPPTGSQSTWNTQSLNYTTASIPSPPALNASLLSTMNESGYIVAHNLGTQTPYLISRNAFYNNNCEPGTETVQYYPLTSWNQARNLPVCDYTDGVLASCLTIPL